MSLTHVNRRWYFAQGPSFSALSVPHAGDNTRNTNLACRCMAAFELTLVFREFPDPVQPVLDRPDGAMHKLTNSPYRVGQPRS